MSAIFGCFFTFVGGAFVGLALDSVGFTFGQKMTFVVGLLLSYVGAGMMPRRKP